MRMIPPRRSKRRVAAIIGSTAALVFASLGGCTKEVGLDHRLSSFSVSLSNNGEQTSGTEAEPLAYVSGRDCQGNQDCEPDQICKDGFCSSKLTIDITAIGTDGNTYPFTGVVHLDVTPGMVVPSSAYVLLVGGKATGVDVFLNRAIGKTNIWVEHDGFVPVPANLAFGQCNDGFDNNGNGLVDLADPGCMSASDDQESEPTMATGATETLFFDNPRIRDIQFTERISGSPLIGQQARVTEGRMVVVNVLANGFFVVDLDEQVPDRMYNGIFIFTFSKPKYIEYGDILCEFSGGVDEFVGMTQVVFPSYEDMHPANKRCNPGTPGIDLTLKPPAPTDVTAEILKEVGLAEGGFYELQVYLNSKMLEQYEANLVTFQNIGVSEKFIACDRNKNGSIDPGDEDECRDECQDDPLCTDLEGYFEFAQWAGLLDEKKKIFASVALADKFRPLRIDYIGEVDQNGLCSKSVTEKNFLQYTCPKRTLESVTGTLRHIYLCPPDWEEDRCDLQFWVLDPRFDGDVVLSQTADMDADGFTIADGDCDDNNKYSFPGGRELPTNGADDDCDGMIDE